MAEKPTSSAMVNQIIEDAASLFTTTQKGDAVTENPELGISIEKHNKDAFEGGEVGEDASGSVSEYDLSATTSGSSVEMDRTLDDMERFKHKLLEDERISQIYKLRHNFSERLDNRSWLHPHGCTNFDYKAIDEDRKAGFEKFKNRIRIENYKYLGSHPEIRAMISLFIKKLLATQPANPVEYLAEFFTSRHESRNFTEVLKDEMKKISRYRVNKMMGLGRVRMRANNELHSEMDDLPDIPENDANVMKKLNIGPLAQDFYFDPNSMPRKKELEEEAVKEKKKKKKPHKYCGCKDWKVIARKLLREQQRNKEQNIQFMTSEEEDEEEEENNEGPDEEAAGKIAEEIFAQMLQPSSSVIAVEEKEEEE